MTQLSNYRKFFPPFFSMTMLGSPLNESSAVPTRFARFHFHPYAMSLLLNATSPRRSTPQTFEQNGKKSRPWNNFSPFSFLFEFIPHFLFLFSFFVFFSVQLLLISHHKNGDVLLRVVVLFCHYAETEGKLSIKMINNSVNCFGLSNK